MTPNPIRGEVAAAIGSLTLTMVVTMDGLARLSAASGYPTLAELYRRLHGTEPMTVMLAIEHFAIRGEVDGKALGKEEAVSQARARLTMDDVMAMQGPLAELLASLLRKSPGDTPQGNAGSGPNPSTGFSAAGSKRRPAASAAARPSSGR
jgi:hypothetical protein